MTNKTLGYRDGLEVSESCARTTPNNCAVRERTGDGRSVGACCFYLTDGITCPRHGVVKLARKMPANVSLATGSILKSPALALVNPVNTVGVMGKGLALQFRNAFPENYTAYCAACARGEVQPGKMFVYTHEVDTDFYWVVNFPTKRHWRDKSEMGDIESGLAALVEFVRQNSVPSIAIPGLGCGLGGLSWFDVRPRIEAAFQAVPTTRVFLYEPAGW